MADRFDDIERKIDSLSALSSQKFDAVDHNFEVVDSRADGLNRKVEILYEKTAAEIRLVAELLGATNEHMDRGFAELRAGIGDTNALLETFLRAQSKTNGNLRNTDADHERRITALEHKP